MNDAERAVCARVAKARKTAKWSQAQLAHWLGSSRDKVASIEAGRTPLKFGLGNAVCDVLNISPRWLVQGLGPPNAYIQVGSNLRSRIPSNLLYTKAYWQFLKPLFDRYWDRALPEFRSDISTKERAELQELLLPAVGDYGAEEVLDIMSRRLLKPLIDRLPDCLWEELYSSLRRLVTDFRREHAKEIEHHASTLFTPLSQKSHKTQKEFLRDVNEFVKYRPVRRPQLPLLLERLRRVTQKRGVKSALAELLDVPLAAVSQWLAGTREPAGETALQLLAYVQSMESLQTKSRKGRDTSAAKTRTRINENKPRPSPPK